MKTSIKRGAVRQPNEFIHGMTHHPRMHLHWSACGINGKVPKEQVEIWSEMSMDAYKAFKRFTGLKFLDDVRLYRIAGQPRIFAVSPNDNLAICVYNFSREF